VKKKPIPMASPHKPKRIEQVAPEGLSPEEQKQWQEEEAIAPEAWRHNNFLVLYQRESQDSIVADLNGKTFFRHLGPIEEVFALTVAMQAAKAQNRPVYEENFEEFSDEDFVDEGMMVLDDIMAVPDAPETDLPDMSEVDNLIDMLRGSFLDELIKPPKKKK
jgi:hypothetical protein